MRQGQRLGKWMNRLLVLVFLVVWATIAGAASYCALTSYCGGGPSGWWQLLVAILAVPIVIYELNNLRHSIQERPRIDVDLFVSLDGQLTRSEDTHSLTTLDLAELLNHYHLVEEEAGSGLLRLGYPFTFVIRNTGNLATRFVKIRLEPTLFPGQTRPIVGSKTLNLQYQPDEKTAIFQGGEDWIIYPQDSSAFQMVIVEKHLLDDDYWMTEIVRDELGTYSHMSYVDGYEESSRFLMFRTLYPLGTYEFNCTVWAEGLKAPLEKTLRLTIVDSKATEHEEMLTKTRETIEQYRQSTSSSNVTGRD